MMLMMHKSTPNMNYQKRDVTDLSPLQESRPEIPRVVQERREQGYTSLQ
jgi:hypothetical protein